MSQYIAVIYRTLSEIAAAYGLRIVGAIIILLIGWLIAAWTGGAVLGALERSAKLDATHSKYFERLTRIAVMIITLVAVLNSFGVQTNSIVAFLGAMGIAVGLAVKVAELNESAVGIYARPWTKTGDFFETKLALLRKVKERFDEEKISIPFPQREIFRHNASDNLPAKAA